MLTGQEIVRREIVHPAEVTKIDDGITPSRGVDPAGYTLGADVPWEFFTLGAGESISFLTQETVTIPNNCIGLLFVKSTYARKGIILVTNSVVDGGYSGKLTTLLFNSSRDDVVLFGAGGFMQLVVAEAHGAESAPYVGRWM